MPDKKLTDNEIIKALECCDGSFDRCGECPLDNVSQEKLRCWELEKSALDLINRLQAENERLETENKRYAELEQGCYVTGYKNIKAEAYKECIEKVKENSNKTELVCNGELVQTDYTITKEKLDNLLKNWG